MHTASGYTRHLLSVAYGNYGIPLPVCLAPLFALTPEPRCGYALLSLSTAKLWEPCARYPTLLSHFVGTRRDRVWQPVVFYVSRPSHVISATIPGRCRPRNLLRSYILLKMYFRCLYKAQILASVFTVSVRLFHFCFKRCKIAAETTAGNKNATLLCPE